MAMKPVDLVALAIFAALTVLVVAMIVARS
jgi:hypothetical protein